MADGGADGTSASAIASGVSGDDSGTLTAEELGQHFRRLHRLRTDQHLLQTRHALLAAVLRYLNSALFK